MSWLLISLSSTLALWPRLFVHDPLRFLFGDHVQAHEVCRSGGLPRTGNDAQHVFRLEDITADKDLLRCEHHLLNGLGLPTADRVHSPVKIHATYDQVDVRESIDWDLGAVFRNHAGRVARLGKDGDCTHRQVLSRMGNRLANRFSDGKPAMLAAAAHGPEISHV